MPHQVSANTQDYTADRILFSYLPPPTFAQLRPLTGADLGGVPVVVPGTILRDGSDYKLWFSDHQVDATHAFCGGTDVLLCNTPALQTGLAYVFVSTNAQQYIAGGGFGVFFAPRLFFVSPSTGPVDGGTLLTLYGTRFSFGSAYACRIHVSVLPATFDAAFQRQLRCRLPTRLPLGAHLLEVSLNGQEFSYSAMNVSVYGTPIVSSLSPSSGPVAGGTQVCITGANFSVGSHVVCRFGASLVGATHALGSRPHLLRCVAPPTTLSATLVLEVSLNGQNFTASGAFFVYYQPPVPASLRPAAGPELGGTSVFIIGERLHCMLATCTYSRVRLVYANTTTTLPVVVSPAISTGEVAVEDFAPAHSLGFTAPLLPVGAVRVRISLNAQQYSAAPGLRLSAYPHPSLTSISPSCGPTLGNTSVWLTGPRLSDGSHYSCDFVGRTSAQLVNGTLLASTLVGCTSPSSVTPVSRPLELTLNGQQYTSDGVQWTYTHAPRLSSVQPVSGSAAGGVALTIHGAGLSSGCELLCDFSSRYIVNATWDEASATLRCITPRVPQLRALHVDVSLNGQQYTADGVTFAVFDEPTVDDVRPVSSPLAGGTTITLRGTGFLDCPSVSCQFGDQTFARATQISHEEVRCETPPISALRPSSTRTGLATDFAVQPPELLVFGDAVVAGGALKLTGGGGSIDRRKGWAVSKLLPPMPALFVWSVRFEVFVGDGTGGEGVSFVYGHLDELPSLIQAGGLSAWEPGRIRHFSGLVVKLYKDGRFVSIVYNGTALGLYEVS